MKEITLDEVYRMWGVVKTEFTWITFGQYADMVKMLNYRII
jgi:hypothetical protein